MSWIEMEHCMRPNGFVCSCGQLALNCLYRKLLALKFNQMDNTFFFQFRNQISCQFQLTVVGFFHQMNSVNVSIDSGNNNKTLCLWSN